MGSFARIPPDDPSNSDDGEAPKLGDLLSGRLSDVEVESVEAVRALRERE